MLLCVNLALANVVIPCVGFQPPGRRAERLCLAGSSPLTKQSLENV